MLAVAVSAAELPERAAAARLRSKDLHRHEGGPIWVLTLESRLRDQLAGLDDLRRSVVMLQTAIDQRIEQNRARWETATVRIEALKAALAVLKKNDPKRKPLEQQIQELRRQAVEPRQLGAQPDVQARLIDLTNQRHKLALAVLGIREAVPRLEAAYQALAADDAVSAALKQINGVARLGPVNPNYRGELRRLGECERAAFTPWVPLYIQSGRVRVGALVNDRSPVTFTWKSETQPTVLTASMLEAAGLSVPHGAEGTTLTFDRGRRTAARRAVVPSLRFGRHVLENVPVWVLPPEAEDLGALIGPQAFTDGSVRVEPERLRLVIQK
jgi:hypothetical protein